MARMSMLLRPGPKQAITREKQEWVKWRVSRCFSAQDPNKLLRAKSKNGKNGA